ncbi:hypothetical protein B0H13DRAFT_2026771 [Mycena leptocephala]|nr:hypothetical protein B0H13DRAFT_2026771 [Mycena leptocephala]
MLYRFGMILSHMLLCPLLCFGISAPASDSIQIAPLPCFVLLSGKAPGPWTLSTFLCLFLPVVMPRTRSMVSPNSFT